MWIKHYSEFEWDTSEGLNGDIWEATFDFKPVAWNKIKFGGNGIIALSKILQRLFGKYQEYA
ncbi:hypothetical protein L3K57_15760 (plasmid) [Enterococcus faecium]|uniref:hypothetical protein n=1 Tax=Enterococcus faecium TaxID=1352 RepID=UPI001F47B43F|nr:hypothetical protein [Enterococcus faecium]UJV65260.1 hypothetical protein L3K57_15760 [Enterococcus faecium]